MTLVKYPSEVKYKISEAAFDVDKEQFFCYVGTMSPNGVMVIKYTIWGDLMPELTKYVGTDYNTLPIRIQYLWEKGQEKCYEKALQFAKEKYQPKPKKKTIFDKWRDFYDKNFGISDYGQ